MRKLTMLLAAIAVMVALSAAVAYAATIEGTSAGENLNESELSDDIFARAGNDTIHADIYKTTGTTPSGSDSDELRGNRGDDTIYALDGDGFDLLNGGSGEDTCQGDLNTALGGSDEFVSCEHIIPPPVV